MYWRAYDRWKAGQRAGVPGAWLVALDAAGSKSMPALGDLYLGINAHVLADLPVLLYQLGLSDENGDSRKPDHDAVNVVLRDIFEPDIHEMCSASTRRCRCRTRCRGRLPTATCSSKRWPAGASRRGAKRSSWRRHPTTPPARRSSTRRGLRDHAGARVRATLAYPPLLAGTTREPLRVLHGAPLTGLRDAFNPASE